MPRGHGGWVLFQGYYDPKPHAETVAQHLSNGGLWIIDAVSLPSTKKPMALGFQPFVSIVVLIAVEFFGVASHLDQRTLSYNHEGRG